MRLTAIFIGAFLMISCNQRADNSGNTAAGSDTAKGNPVITFDTTAHDYGTLIEGEIVSYTFKFSNTGDGPLVIRSAAASCGCTIPNYSKKPTPPGGKGKIVVEFDTRGKIGNNHKTISIRSNSDPSVTILNIFAEVVRPSE